MALTRHKTEPKPVEELSDRTLRQRVERGERAIRDLPEGQELTAAERAEALSRAEAAAADVVAGRTELDRRAAKKTEAETRNEFRTAGARAAATRGQRVLTEDAAARLQRLGRDVGLKLDPKRLSTEDLDEILELASRIRENPDETDRARLEQLCEQAADASGFFDERRAKTHEVRTLAALREKTREALAPRRPRFEEPGAIVLPRIIFSWLETSRGQWSVVDIGVLATLLSIFEEPARVTLLQNATFEEDDAGQVLIIAAPRERLRFDRGVDPGTGAPGTSGGVSLRTSLERLAQNGWFAINVGRYRTEVRLGPRALELRDRA